jgi:hypothetical protein
MKEGISAMSATISVLRTLPRSRALLLLLIVLTVLAAAAVAAAAFHGAPAHVPAGAMSFNTKPDMSFN